MLQKYLNHELNKITFLSTYKGTFSGGYMVFNILTIMTATYLSLVQLWPCYSIIQCILSLIVTIANAVWPFIQDSINAQFRYFNLNDTQRKRIAEMEENMKIWIKSVNIFNINKYLSLQSIAFDSYIWKSKWDPKECGYSFLIYFKETRLHCVQKNYKLLFSKVPDWKFKAVYVLLRHSNI